MERQRSVEKELADTVLSDVRRHVLCFCFVQSLHVQQDLERVAEIACLVQSDAVLSMALRRLTSLEAGKLREEAAALKATVGGLEQLLANEQLVLETVKRESQEIADKHGDERRTTVRLWLLSCLPVSMAGMQPEWNW